ncbi:MAG TPA: nucleotidyltransferase [Clostridia bacterium]|nr:nucleotidyltransferase [Clostridia bacterium]
MKVVGIVSEYNPFHNGHKYHIQAAKEACGADYALCIMSGSFVQRGEPAIFDKWSRAAMAVMNGADLVVELPVVYACQPAEIFALGAVKVLNAMNIIDFICFGSELGDTATLHNLARLFRDEPESFKQLLKAQLDQGNSYPKALSNALSTYAGGEAQSYQDDILRSPNNVLGIEYIKALMSLKSSIEPVAVKRIESNHNDTGITSEIASATAVRNEIRKNGISEKIRLSMPGNSTSIIESSIESNRHPLYLDDFSDMLLYRLRLIEENDLRKYLNTREGIENRLKKYAQSCTSCEELIEAVRTKRYTRTYIQRLLCHLLLDIQKSDIALFKDLNCPAYIRVLAFNENGTRLLKDIKSRSSYPVISKVADFRCQDERISRMFAYDILSTNIYNLAYRTPAFKKGSEDYLTSPYYHRT